MCVSYIRDFLLFMLCLICLQSVCSQEQNFSRSINGWVDADWNDNLENEGEQEDDQEGEWQCEENYSEGPIETDGVMQSLDNSEGEEEVVQDRICEGTNIQLTTQDEHTSTPSATQQPIPSSCASTEWSGFKVVKDNFDQNIRPSFQRTNKQTLSTDYCHVYAVKDRINLSSLSDTQPDINADINPTDILPTDDDLAKLKEEFCIFTARCTVAHSKQLQGSNEYEIRSGMWVI